MVDLGGDDLERLVVVVTAHLTLRHLGLLS
jgi:hypothetical protein